MLPVIKSPVFECKLPVLNKTIKHRAYCTAEEKAIITAFSDPEKKKDQMNNLVAVMKATMMDEVDLEKLSSIDFLYLGMMLRAKSKGEVIDMTFRCIKEECKKPYEYSADIEQIIKFKNVEKQKNLVELYKDFFIEIGPSKMQFLVESDQLSEKYKASESEESNDQDLRALEIIETNVRHCIYKIIDGGKIYDTFTTDELQESIISKLSQKQLFQIFEAKSSLISMKIEFEAVCSHCGDKVKHEINDFFEFLL